ncbi:pyruvate dehydrogenase kinase [Micractinium conductrix]|uniref:Protein-serine/threonine kinase n=1 Tax=Micractinium conductrix TaxID=554055 RepID=A0A2P6VIC8_9CHLO|nr:pyruvate dehydrogenase kinase [Micractinium conductrix]|eukprot:PSC73841.1 pyruvate dehydrogenase kinase [Micractinium conductrix]
MLSAAPRALLCSLVVRPLISLRGFAPGTASSNVAATGAAAGRRCVWNEAAPRDEELHRDSFYDTVIETWAQKPVRKLTLRQLLNFGRDAWFDQSRVLESSRFVQAELPKRLARRLMDLQLLPYIVVSNPNIKKVYNAYYHGFATLKSLAPVTSMQQNEVFVGLLRRLVDEHSPMLDALAQGMREVRSKPVVGEQLQLDAFLENMLRSRISRRVMAEQHINLTNQRPGYIGIICTQLHLADAVDFAASRCKQAFVEHYGVAPEVFVSGDTSLTIPYIPAHLDYMLYELLKNSARATVERHLGRGRSSLSDPLRRAKLPPIHVRLCSGDQDVTVRLSDQGGGIPQADLERVWQFGFTTSPAAGGAAPGGRGARPRRPARRFTSSQEAGSSILGGAAGGGGGGGGGGGTGAVMGSSGSGSFPPDATGGAAAGQASLGEGLGLDNASPGASFGAGFGAAWAAMESAGGSGVGRFRIAGLGFGLPLSRLYARYFGGDLRLVNMPGYGVDSFLTLKRLEDAETSFVKRAAQAVAAAAAAAGGGAQQQQGQAAAKKRPTAGATGADEGPEVDQLEEKRKQVAEELRNVEKQIYDLESNYFGVSSAMGNAIRGYEGFLGASKKVAPAVQPEERLFSWSSITGQAAGGGGGAPE